MQTNAVTRKTLSKRELKLDLTAVQYPDFCWIIFFQISDQ